MKPRLPVVLWAGCLAVLSSAGAADFTVINTNNAGAGSLRQAITDANATPGKDRVVFAIPGTGLQVIRPVTSLPEIADPVEIDGYTQPGSSPNTLADADNAVRLIELDGTVSRGDGLVLAGGLSEIKGLIVRKFGNAIDIKSSSNLISGNLFGRAELVLTNGNDVGIYIFSGCCNKIGGNKAEERNIVAGNGGSSIRMFPGVGSSILSNNTVYGNFLGVLPDGNTASASPNSSAISIGSTFNTRIGDLHRGARNIISGGFGGVTIGEGATNTSVIGNHIGVGVDAISLLTTGQVSGVFFQGASGYYGQEARIEGNLIANYSAGVAVPEPPFEIAPINAVRRVTVLSNSIFSCRNYGIALGDFFARTNDVFDFDVGANDRQNYPELHSAVFTNGGLRVVGKLPSKPSAAYHLEFFADPTPSASGFGQGKVFLGSTNVTTDGNGNAPFDVLFDGASPMLPYILGTATDSQGNTSMSSKFLKARSADGPLIHLHPKSTALLPYTNLTLVADVTGAEPLALQWKHDGVEILGETNLTLSLSNIVWESRGSYSLTASNAFGVVETIPATLTVIAVPTILTQPTNVLVSVGTNFTFVVQAGGIQPIAYQWRRDGVALPGATNSSLTLSNIDWPQRGSYSVVVSNAFGVAESAPSTLTVRVRPVIVQQPLSQMVASGSVVYLSVAISNSATAPLTYMLRSNNSLAATVISTSYVAVFPIGPVRTNAGYNIHVTNIFNSAGILSARATLTVVPDTDGDGLPDAFEDAYGLNRLDASDAALDVDGDGVTNLDEYRAGSDPADAANQLRISIQDAAEQGNVIEFAARSNRVYRVQYQDGFTGGNWRTLVDVPARETNRVERWTDPAPVTPRFYRLQTPPVANE